MSASQKNTALRDRLNQLIKTRKYKSFTALAVAGGLTRQTLDSAADRNSMRLTTAEQFCERLKIQPAWLLFGAGPVELSDGALIGGLGIITGNERPANYAKHENRYAYIKKAKTRLSAGGGTEAEEGFESERFGFLKSWLRQKATSTSDEILFLIDVEGDSMLPTFASKDMVLVDKGLTELRSEGYFAIGEGNFINIKRLKREDDAIHVISDNPDKSMYPTRTIDGEELRIIGRVIWFAREVQ